MSSTMAMMPMDLPCGATMELREGSLRMSININFPKELLQVRDLTGYGAAHLRYLTLLVV